MGLFAWEFIRKPFTTGAVCASSRFLAREMCREIGIENARSVAEYGPGTGALTREIRARMQPDSRYFAVELNKSMIQVFKKHFPDETIYCDSADNIGTILDEHEHLKTVDCIVSGLPFAAFPGQVQKSIIRSAYERLSAGGIFVTFTYSHCALFPSARRFRALLNETFDEVKLTKSVLLNVPPAFAYKCKKN